ncbi:hypothetical protein DMB66_49225 [Actinoplanes sp. ATCC 53533]|nr:hypothetical protein DMB66_49225 [Actinoplanes sp. ATCC 53533]
MNDGTYHIGRFNPATRVIDGCVTVKNNLMTANTPIVHHPCTAAGTNDQWRFRSVPGKPTFRIVAESSRLCLSIAPDNTQNNAPLIQKTCGTSATDLTDQFTYPPTASPNAVPQPATRNQAIVAMQGSANDTALAPLTYSYTDDLGSLKIGHQSNPDSVMSLQWSTPNGERYVGEPRLGVQGDGKMEVIARNQADGDLWLGTQTAKGAATFGAFEDVGGALPAQPAIGRMPTNGQLVVFCNLNGRLWQLPQDGKNVPYGAWRASDGSLIGFTGIVGTPTVVALRDSLRIFAITTAGTMLTATYEDGTMSSTVNLGGSGLNGNVSAVVYPGYWVRVFSRGADGVIVSKAQKDDGTWPAEWSPVGDFAAAGPPSAVLDPVRGRTGVVARGADDQIHAVFETGQLSGEWGSWQTIASRPIVTDPTAFSWTGSGGQTWGYVVRDNNSQPLLYSVNDIGGAGLRVAAGRQSPFTMHALPVPPK